MKVISIDSPKRLQDRTVKAVITVAEEDYIPLIMLADRAYKGDVIEIDDAGEENIEEDTSLNIIIRSIMPIIQSQLNIAEKYGYQKAIEEIEKEGV